MVVVPFVPHPALCSTGILPDETPPQLGRFDGMAPVDRGILTLVLQHLLRAAKREGRASQFRGPGCELSKLFEDRVVFVADLDVAESSL
jgi:hypothetical protein